MRQAEVELARGKRVSEVCRSLGISEQSYYRWRSSPPPTIPGGLYRLANGFLSWPDTLYLMSGQPNLRMCTYVKDVH